MLSERLVPCPGPVQRHLPPLSGTAIVTGGTKGLGFEFSKGVVESGTSAAVLMARSGAVALEKLTEMAGDGGAIFVVSCDTSKREAVEAVLEWAREWLPPVQVSFPRIISFVHVPTCTKDAVMRTIY